MTRYQLNRNDEIILRQIEEKMNSPVLSGNAKRAYYSKNIAFLYLLIFYIDKKSEKFISYSEDKENYWDKNTSIWLMKYKLNELNKRIIRYDLDKFNSE